MLGLDRIPHSGQLDAMKGERLFECKTFARRLADYQRYDAYEAQMQHYEAAGFRHTGRTTKNSQGLEKPVWHYNPNGPMIWSPGQKQSA